MNNSTFKRVFNIEDINSGHFFELVKLLKEDDAKASHKFLRKYKYLVLEDDIIIWNLDGSKTQGLIQDRYPIPLHSHEEGFEYYQKETGYTGEVNGGGMVLPKIYPDAKVLFFSQDSGTYGMPDKTLLDQLKKIITGINVSHGYEESDLILASLRKRG